MECLFAVKIFDMERNYKLYRVLPLIILFFISGCGDDDPDQYTRLYIGDINGSFIEGAVVRIFDSETNFQLNENPTQVLQSDENGQVKLDFFQEPKIWYRVTKGDLDNSRYGKRSNHGEGRFSHSHQCFQLSQAWPNIDEFEIFLTTPPAQLEVTVFNDGQVVPFADVQLYWSLEDYENDVTPDTKITAQDLVYPYCPSLNSSTEHNNRRFFYHTANEEGVALFDNLESREYWLRIKEEDMSNDDTMIKIPFTLSAEPGIINRVEVGIK